jgi:hypothetical protein
MTMRARLPNKRKAETLSFEHSGTRGGNPIAYTATLGFYDDGRMGEIFMRATDKAGSELDIQVRDISILCSILLQHGCELETIRHALTRNADNSASGPLGALLDRIVTEAML